MTKRKHTPKPSPWRSGTVEHQRMQAVREARKRVERFLAEDAAEDLEDVRQYLPTMRWDPE